ncbi:MAG: HAD-IIB family hydrolase [Sphaerochaetaceae bacterium]
MLSNQEETFLTLFQMWISAILGNTIVEVAVHTYTGMFFCDVDGTILPHGEHSVSPAFFSLVEEAQEANFLFCISSGRFHESLIPLFAPVASHVVFSSSNGCRVLYQGAELFPNRGISRALAEEITATLHAWGATSLISTTEAICLPSFAREQMEARIYLADGYARFFNDFCEVPGEVLQITAVCDDHLQSILGKSRKAWASRFHVVTTGSHIFDICPTSKGESLKSISTHFSVPLAQTYAFGDDENDIPMLESAGKGYVMGSAHPGMRSREFEHCHDLVGTIRGIVSPQHKELW